MSLKQTLSEDMKQAMRDKDAQTLSTIRMVISEVKNVEIDHGEQNEAGVQKIVARQVKQLKEAAEEFARGDRQDLVEENQAQIKILQKYLPQQLSEDEIKAIISTVKTDNPDVEGGRLIGLVMKQTGGKADGGLVARLINQA